MLYKTLIIISMPQIQKALKKDSSPGILHTYKTSHYSYMQDKI